jgi:type I restriction enzyme R subunit
VISGSNNDDPAWKAWTDGAAHEQLITRFKKPLFHADPARADPLAFLVVKSMLLTGFDAPIEGVMYLDRPIREAELLQAVARVNRSGFGKRCGIVVDYYGVARHLKEALAAYADEEVEGALASLKDEVPVLRDRHLRVVDLFRQRGIESLEDTEACVVALEIEKLRAEFEVKLKAFLASLDTVLPRPEGLPYSADAKRLAYIYARARNRYKDTPVLGKDVGAKVRKLIDDHVISLGIDPKIPPIQLTDADFDRHLARAANDRAKASEMEHAIRSHISKHADEDPVLYRKLGTAGRHPEDVGRAVERADRPAAEAHRRAACRHGRRRRCAGRPAEHCARPSCARCWMWCAGPDAHTGRAAAAEGCDGGAGGPAGPGAAEQP